MMKKLLTLALASFMTLGAWAHCGTCSSGDDGKKEGHAKECKSCDKSKDKKKDKDCKPCEKKSAEKKDKK